MASGKYSRQNNDETVTGGYCIDSDDKVDEDYFINTSKESSCENEYTDSGYKVYYVDSDIPSAGVNNNGYDDTCEDESITGDNTQFSTPLSTPVSTKKRHPSTLYDENHYALAQVLSSSYSHKEVDDKNETNSVSRCTQLKNCLKKKKYYFLTTPLLLITGAIVYTILMCGIPPEKQEPGTIL